MLPEMKTSSEKNGQKEFPTPLACRVDQVTYPQLHIHSSCFFYLKM